MRTPENWVDLPRFAYDEPPGFNADQLAQFTAESISAREVMRFDPYEAVDELEKCDGKTVVMVDLGGNKVAASVATLEGRHLKLHTESAASKGINGESYYDFLAETAELANRNGWPVGFSSAGVTEGTVLVESVNASAFVDTLHKKHGGDVKELFPTLASFENDAVAGMISGAMEAVRHDTRTRNVVYNITGGGSGLAVLLGDESGTYRLFATEAGHVPLVDALNPGQETPCGLSGNQFVCIERAAASGAGIEDLYSQRTGVKLGGPEIEERYHAGDQVAAELYEGSAVLTAHIIQGVADVFELDLAAPSTAIVAHGGGFKFRHYDRRVDQVIAANLGAEVRFMTTFGYTPNACADGAGKAALIAANA